MKDCFASGLLFLLTGFLPFSTVSGAETQKRQTTNAAVTGIAALQISAYCPAANALWKRERDWLMKVAEPAKECNGYKWINTWPDDCGKKYYAGGHGATFVGAFFLALYQSHKDREALEYAEGTARWLMHEANQVDGTYYWNEPIGSRLTTSDMNHGNTGVGDFLRAMHAETGKEEYLEYAMGVAKWLKMIARPANPGKKWPAGNNSPKALLGSKKDFTYRTSECTGTAGICHFLYHLYVDTGEEWVKQMADEGMQSLISQAVKEDGGYKWPVEEGSDIYCPGSGRGVAGVGYAFLVAHYLSHGRENVIGKSMSKFYGHITLKRGTQVNTANKYFGYAKGAGDWLTRNAVMKNRFCYWRTDLKGKPVISLGICRAGRIPAFLIELAEASGQESYGELAEMNVNARARKMPRKLTLRTPRPMGKSDATFVFVAEYAKALNRPDIIKQVNRLLEQYVSQTEPK